jgi:hypothetical protein
LIQAHNHPVLDSVKWYGSDGSALNEAITKNIEAARFAVETNFLNPLAGGGGREGHNKNETIQFLDDQIIEKVGLFHRSYDDFAYDALWVSALSEATLEQWKNLSQATNSSMNSNLDSLKKSFVHTADSFSGITGKTILNKYGDRKFGHYDFWGLKNEDINNLNFQWVRVGGN